MGSMASRKGTDASMTNDSRHRPTRDSFCSDAMDVTDQQTRENQSDGETIECGKSKRKKGKKRLRQQQMLERLQVENKSLQDDKALLNQELMDVRRQLVDCRKQCDQWKDKNEAMLQRYSEVVSNQLMNNNPSIQDINYRDQPRQMAETFRAELYNKQWGDAFDILNTSITSERDKLEILRDLCRDSYLICTYVLVGQVDHLRKALDPFAADGGRSTESSSSVCPLTNVFNKLPEVVRDEFINNSRQFKDFEKILKEQCCSTHATTRLGAYGEGIVTRMEPYINSCLQICWDMLLQKPPMCLDFNMTEGCNVKPEVCDFYSYEGSTVEFVVWPVVYRHYGGPVLNKGIVQASTNGWHNNLNA